MNITTVMQSLDLMWKGMLSIFIVIAAIFIITMLITRIKDKNKEENKDV